MRDAHAINLSWLLRLRWGAVVGQGALVLLARLGLFLARAVLDQLGGRLEVRSAPGKGTQVEMSWPGERLRQFARLSSEAGGASLQPPGCVSRPLHGALESP